jgi:hypothetical protein
MSAESRSKSAPPDFARFAKRLCIKSFAGSRIANTRRKDSEMINTTTETIFPLGQIYSTPGAIETLTESAQSIEEFLNRHQRGDWGVRRVR